jgi:hypothetical protein
MILYSGGRREMFRDTNCYNVITNLLVWISGLVKPAHEKSLDSLKYPGSEA